MTPVTMAAFLALSQANINEFLTSFFDGASHTIGTQTYTFPQCDMKFGRYQLPRSIPRPVIVVESGTAGDRDGVYAGTKRNTIRRDFSWRFVVITQNANQESAGDWKLNDSVVGLLTTVLDCCRRDLAAGGQKIIRVGLPQKVPDPAIQFAVINVIIRSELAHDNK